jgi:aspartate/methionine/tyrosine aminotransferase
MISNRIGRLELSPTLRINAKAKVMQAEGIDVIDFSVGEPDFPTPSDIKDAAKKSAPASRRIMGLTISPRRLLSPAAPSIASTTSL